MEREHNQLLVCILAGGLSRRMGRDKSRLRLGRRTLVGHLRATAAELGCPVRVVREDVVERCGPLGGIYTALMSTRAQVVMFLACDMPFVSVAWLCQLRRELRKKDCAAFTATKDRVGFPLILRREALEIVNQQMRAASFSLQHLAMETHARKVRLPAARQHETWNINTPEDWAGAKERARRRSKISSEFGFCD